MTVEPLESPDAPPLAVVVGLSLVIFAVTVGAVMFFIDAFCFSTSASVASPKPRAFFVSILPIPGSSSSSTSSNNFWVFVFASSANFVLSILSIACFAFSAFSAVLARTVTVAVFTT